MNILFGLQASSLVSELSSAVQDVLISCSPSGSASATVAELMLEGVLPEKDRVAWLEDQYLGTWTHPSSAVSNYFNPEDYKKQTKEERLEAYQRLIQSAEVVEHQLSNGRYVVYLLRAVSLMHLLGMMRWVRFADSHQFELDAVFTPRGQHAADRS